MTRLAGRYELVCAPNPDFDDVEGWQPSFRNAALHHGFPIVAIEELYDDPDITLLSVEYSKLIKPSLMRSTKLYNVHFSLLPNYRGCHTAIWPILNGEREHGVTLHHIDAGMDTGDIIAQHAFRLDGMTAFEAYMECQRLGTDLAIEWIDTLVQGTPPVVKQPLEGSSYKRSQMDFSRREISLGSNLEMLFRNLRAFTFPAYQYPTLNGRDIVEFGRSSAPGLERHEASDGPAYLRFRDELAGVESDSVAAAEPIEESPQGPTKRP